MFKIAIIAVLALAICITADPVHQRPIRRRILARQQQQPAPAPTGYPPAGVTPEIPFELPTETEKPAVAQEPDEVYGPPEVETQQLDEAYSPTETVAQKPDEVYGPPEIQTVQPEIETIPEVVEETVDEAGNEENVEEVAEDLDEANEEVISDENDSVIAIATTFEKPARLVYQRFPQRRQSPTAVPARLVKTEAVKPVNFIYTTSFQTFPQK